MRLDWPLPEGEAASFAHLRTAQGELPLHTHESCQLLAPVRGVIRVALGKKIIDIEPPMALLVGAREPHAITYLKGPAELFVVHIAALAREKAGVEASLFPQLSVLCWELIYQLTSQSDDERGRELAYCQLVHQLSLTQQTRRPSLRSEYVERALAYLSEHAHEPFAIGRLARRVGTSPRHLNRCFQRDLDIAPRDYVTELRMQKAEVLLRTTSEPVQAIARAAGYPSVFHFNRLFQRRYKCSPTVFRNRS